jgi:hypothetical protein
MGGMRPNPRELAPLWVLGACLVANVVRA